MSIPSVVSVSLLFALATPRWCPPTSAAEMNPLPSRRLGSTELVRPLADSSYEGAVRQVKGFALVLFYQSEPALDDAALVAKAGAEKNHLQFFKVNVTTNRHLASRLDSGALGNVQRGVMINGEKVVNRGLPCVVLLHRGTPIDSRMGWDDAEFESWLTGSIVQWLYAEVDGLYGKYQETRKQDLQSPSGELDLGTNTEVSVALLIDSLDQLGAIQERTWQDQAPAMLTVLGAIKQAKAIEPAIPAIVRLLPGEHSSQASHTLARLGPSAAGTVRDLIKVAQRLDNDRSGTGEDFDWEPSLAAIQALGAIGAGAKPAVPLLTRIAERQYPEAVKTDDPAEWTAFHSVGLMAAVALAAIEPAKPIQGDTGLVYGKCLHVVTGRASGQRPAPGTVVYFWRNHSCHQAVADKDGKYQIELSPGEYVCGSAESRPQVFCEQLLQPTFHELKVVKVKRGTSQEENLATSITFVD